MSSKRQIAVVTGVTQGIGKAVALGLVERGFALRVLARASTRFAQLRREALQTSPSADVQLYEADLSSVSSTEAAVSSVLADDAPIDLLFQSAGLLPGGIERTDEGIERSFSVSFLTRFVIARRIVPQMADREDALFLNMAGAGQKGRIYFDDPNFSSRRFQAMAVVKQFQQANDAMVVELHHRYRERSLRSYCFMPGLVDTAIHRHWPPAMRFLMPRLLKPLFMTTADRAAQVPLAIVDGRLNPRGPLVSPRGQTIEPDTNLTNAAYRSRVQKMAEDLIVGVSRHAKTRREATSLANSMQ